MYRLPLVLVLLSVCRCSLIAGTVSVHRSSGCTLEPSEIWERSGETTRDISSALSVHRSSSPTVPQTVCRPERCPRDRDSETETREEGEGQAEGQSGVRPTQRVIVRFGSLSRTDYCALNPELCLGSPPQSHLFVGQQCSIQTQQLSGRVQLILIRCVCVQGLHHAPPLPRCSKPTKAPW